MVLIGRLLRIAFVSTIPIVAVFVAICTRLVVIGHDYSQEATVGVIARFGFPVWFVETAPGISVTGGVHFDRLLMNVGAWIALLTLLVALDDWRKASKRGDGPPGADSDGAGPE